MVFAGSIDSDWKIEDKLTNIIRVLQGLSIDNHFTTARNQSYLQSTKHSARGNVIIFTPSLREVLATEEIDYNLGFKQIWNKT